MLSNSPEPRASANRSVVIFLAGFALSILGFSLLFQIAWIDSLIIVPMTEALAAISNVIIRPMGFDTHVEGTTISEPGGFAVNILKGCNGAYVLAIYLSAVLAFPSTAREKAVGVLLGIPAVQGINLVRIASLYYIGARHPALFERFHYHVWQTVVIVLSMIVWIAWAEILVKNPRRQS